MRHCCKFTASGFDGSNTITIPVQSLSTATHWEIETPLYSIPTTASTYERYILRFYSSTGGLVITVTNRVNLKFGVYDSSNTLIVNKSFSKFLIAALIHDVLCENHQYIDNDREFSTVVFDALLKASDVSAFKRFFMKHSVNFFQRFCRW